MDIVGALPLQLRIFVKKRLGVPIKPWFARLVGLHKFMELVHRSRLRTEGVQGEDSADLMIQRLLENNRIGVLVTNLGCDAELIGSEPLIVVANHPHGILDGLLLMRQFAWTGRVSKMLTTVLAGGVTDIATKLILVDQYRDAHARKANVLPALQMTRLLRGGGMVVAFPSGSVSSLDWTTFLTKDSPWEAGIARVARLTKARVVPVFIAGGNSYWFHLLDRFAPKVRSVLLLREFLWKRGHVIPMVIGRSFGPEEIAATANDEEATELLHKRCMELRRAVRV